MKKLLLLLSLCFLIASCDNSIEICDQPEDGIPEWMNELISPDSDSELTKYFYFQSAEYKKQQVFIANNCCPFCGTIVVVMNCKGEVIGNLGSDIQLSELKNVELFWTPEDFLCSVN